MNRSALVARYVVDLITVLALALAGFIALQPESQVRAAWTKYRSEARAKDAAKRLWPQIGHLSSPLSAAAVVPDVVEVSDYECPFCRTIHASVDSAIAAGVKIGLLHLPGPTHPQAEGAAIAALCAETDGRFREMHAQLMESSMWRSDANWTREAQLAGVTDLEDFARCMGSAEVRERLLRHRALAESLGVRATPTFLARGAYRVGVVSTADLLRLSKKR